MIQSSLYLRARRNGGARWARDSRARHSFRPARSPAAGSTFPATSRSVGPSPVFPAARGTERGRDSKSHFRISIAALLSRFPEGGQMRWSNLRYLLSFLLVSFAVLAEPAAPSTPSPEVPKRDLVGWDGAHFFVQSPDGSFYLQPYGYVQTDYRVYTGDGVPADTFTIRRARFGFQGRLDTYYEFAFLADFADRNS